MLNLEKINLIIETLNTLTLLDILELIKKLENIYNFEKYSTLFNTQPITVEVEKKISNIEQSTFEVSMISIESSKKMTVLKLIRTLTNLSLTECKKLVDNLPAIVKSNISKEEAESLKKDLENAGATILLK
uniref:Ribosomal protein L12 n=1 Tax=Spumella sp. NIES-1846 TaxID=2490549 RepID=A0A455RGT3_9STRA|nr:ribosomal protein L12 [Spumella sp. NIES-1846]